jgi:putative protease
MPYDLVADGKQVDLGDRKYLLSPQDLAGLEVLPELARLGVSSLKIEGRLKSPEYVASITRVYRNALDQLAASASYSLDVDHSRYEMEMAFSRGLYTGWFQGTNHPRLVHARFGKKRGVFLGEVTRIQNDQVWINLRSPLKAGDGVVFDAGAPEEKEEGGRVFEVLESRARERRDSPQSTKPGLSPFPSDVKLAFGRGAINFGRVHVGDKVWKTSDPELDRQLRQTFEGSTPGYRRAIDVEVHGRSGEPISLVARDTEGNVVRVDSGLKLIEARNRPLTTGRLQEQLGRLGGTPFKLGRLNNQIEGEVLLPISELNRLRRELVRELEDLRARPRPWTLVSTRESDVAHPESNCSSDPTENGREHSTQLSTKPHLITLSRNLPQLEAILGCGVETVYCEFENPKLYRDAVALFRSSRNRTPQSAIFVAPPRIFKMGEEWTLKQVRCCEADGYLVRNYDHLRFFERDRKVGDFSLNIANRMAAEYFRNEFGLERVTASYDLNFTQLEALLKAASPDWFEITIHQHIPMFHMEHCVFCAFLSQGTDYTNCGRPCDRHDLKLRDRVGAEHPVKADVGCRNTVFNSLAQTGAEFVSRFVELGARHFRIEFLTETAEVVEKTISKYRRLLGGEITGAELWRELKLLNQLGVTRGQMK